MKRNIIRSQITTRSGSNHHHRDEIKFSDNIRQHKLRKSVVTRVFSKERRLLLFKNNVLVVSSIMTVCDFKTTHVHVHLYYIKDMKIL